MMEDSVVFYRAPQFVSCHVPDVCMCLDPDPHKPYIPLMTNIHGKAAVYFYTGGHGGDNFKFRAYTDSQWCDKPCLEDKPENVFTNWRKVFVDHAAMPVRNIYPSPRCTIDGKFQQEYSGTHNIATAKYFEWYNGVFDDCFIEIEKSRELSGEGYYLALDSCRDPRRPSLGEYYENWAQPNELDTVLIIGIDHYEAVCAENCGIFGKLNLGDYKCFTAVGYIADYSLNGGVRKIDGYDYDKYNFLIIPTINTACHELTHNIAQSDTHIDNYGLMCGGEIVWVSIEPPPGQWGPFIAPARRSYHHSDTIIELRNAIPFDVSEH